jgi:Zn ribbon nucleic-acid-binding protein
MGPGPKGPFVSRLPFAIVLGVDICPECGNRDMSVRVADGIPIHECGLCGAHFGERRVVETLDDAEEARQRGVAVEVWPLVRALDRLQGLAVRDACAGDAAQRTLPFVDLAVTAPAALLQLENLAKSLLLGAGALKCHWILEVEYHRHLSFVLKPRHGGGFVTPEQVRDARADLHVLRRHLERDVKLQWWRHAEDRVNG